MSRRELVPRDDQPTVNARRAQKVYADDLGRSFKTQIMKCRGLRSEVQRGNIRGLRELQYCKSDPGCLTPVVPQSVLAELLHHASPNGYDDEDLSNAYDDLKERPRVVFPGSRGKTFAQYSFQFHVMDFSGGPCEPSRLSGH